MAERKPIFRLFELRISVYVDADSELPETFNEWVERAGFKVDGASPTTLESVRELRYPLADDVVEKRRGLRRPWA